MLGISLLLLANGAIFVGSIAHEVNAINAHRRQYGQDILKNWPPQRAQQVIAYHGSLDKFLDTIIPQATFTSVLQTRMRMFDRDEMLLNAVVLPLAWPWLFMLALLIFQFSMRRARIRQVHVLRCVLYSFDLVLWAIVLVVASGILALGYGDNSGAGWGPTNAPVMAIRIARDAVVILGTLRLTIAYRDYLRFDHPRATVLSALLITVLLVVAIECLVSPRLAYNEMLHEPVFGRFLRW
jgi:hypothetical protein